MSTTWNTAVYIRLSNEDGDGKIESVSVSSQRKIIYQYVEDHREFAIYDTYIDDGWSGGNFERPGFKRMMDDIYAGYINCVIVKDLSRFGRNYAESGRYIDDVFPRMRVRFIAINNNVDTEKDVDVTSRYISLGIQNVINESYLAATSASVRSSLNAMAREGKFTGSVPPYGYKRDPYDKHHFVIDEEAAKVVRRIFKMSIDGFGSSTIAKQLCRDMVDSPAVHIAKMRNPQAVISDGVWMDATVNRILHNPVYIGTMVHGMARNISYKSTKKVRQDKDKWIVVENTHEPIVSIEDYNIAQDMSARRCRSMHGPKNSSLFAKMIYCGVCGSQAWLVSSHYKDVVYKYYNCRSAVVGIKEHRVRIKYDDLYNTVLQTIRHMSSIAVSIKDFDMITRSDETAVDYTKMIDDMRKEIQKIAQMKSGLYIDLKTGIICSDEYTSLKNDLSVRIEELEEKIENASRLREEQDIANNGISDFISVFSPLGDLQVLTRELLVNLIDRIDINADGSVSLKFKCQDVFENAIKGKVLNN